MAISNSIEADCHKHWMLQMFLGSQKDLNIEISGQCIHCSAILVNMDTPHTFNADGESHFTMLIDPTTELGRVMRGLLKDQPFYVLPHEKTIVMQQALFNSPDEFFEKHQQRLSPIKRWLYRSIGRKLMNRNVERIRA